MQISIFHKAAYLHETAEIELLKGHKKQNLSLNFTLVSDTELMNLLKQIKFVLLIYPFT